MKRVKNTQGTLDSLFIGAGAGSRGGLRVYTSPQADAIQLNTKGVVGCFSQSRLQSASVLQLNYI